jgi:hypothetical protein
MEKWSVARLLTHPDDDDGGRQPLKRTSQTEALLRLEQMLSEVRSELRQFDWSVMSWSKIQGALKLTVLLTDTLALIQAPATQHNTIRAAQSHSVQKRGDI